MFRRAVQRGAPNLARVRESFCFAWVPVRRVASSAFHAEIRYGCNPSSGTALETARRLPFKRGSSRVRFSVCSIGVGEISPGRFSSHSNRPITPTHTKVITFLGRHLERLIAKGADSWQSAMEKERNKVANGNTGFALTLRLNRQ